MESFHRKLIAAVVLTALAVGAVVYLNGYLDETRPPDIYVGPRAEALPFGVSQAVERVGREESERVRRVARDPGERADLRCAEKLLLEGRSGKRMSLEFIVAEEAVDWMNGLTRRLDEEYGGHVPIASKLYGVILAWGDDARQMRLMVYDVSAVKKHPELVVEIESDVHYSSWIRRERRAGRLSVKTLAEELAAVCSEAGEKSEAAE